MRKDDLIYIGHMLDTARLAVEKVKGIDRVNFDKDENLRLHSIHCSCRDKNTLPSAPRQRQGPVDDYFLA